MKKNETTSFENDFSENYENVPSIYKFSEGYGAFKSPSNKYGFIDNTGTIVVHPNYDSVGFFSEGIVSVAEQKSTTLIVIKFIDKNEHKVGVRYDVRASSVKDIDMPYFKNGICCIDKNFSDKKYIDRTGNEIEDLKKYVAELDFNQEGLAKAMLNYRAVVITKKGQLVKTILRGKENQNPPSTNSLNEGFYLGYWRGNGYPRYNYYRYNVKAAELQSTSDTFIDATTFHEGIAFVRKVSRNKGKFVNTRFRKVASLPRGWYVYGSQFYSEGIIPIGNSLGHLNLLDVKSGRKILKENIVDRGFFYKSIDGIARLVNNINKKFYYYNTRNGSRLQIVSDVASDFSEGLACVKLKDEVTNNDKWCYIDKQGTIIFSFFA